MANALFPPLSSPFDAYHADLTNAVGQRKVLGGTPYNGLQAPAEKGSFTGFKYMNSLPRRRF